MILVFFINLLSFLSPGTSSKALTADEVSYPEWANHFYNSIPAFKSIINSVSLFRP